MGDEEFHMAKERQSQSQCTTVIIWRDLSLAHVNLQINALRFFFKTNKGLKSPIDIQPIHHVQSLSKGLHMMDGLDWVLQQPPKDACLIYY